MFPEPYTLLAINVANLLTLSAALFVIMGRDLSLAAAAARNALIVQALGWIAILLSTVWRNQWPDWVLSTFTMVCYSASNWLSFQALQGWLGPRPYRRTLLTLVVLMPLGYALTFASYPLRVGWANLLTALQLLILARAALWPLSKLAGRWRLLLMLCLLAMSVLTLGRGILGAFFTELYPRFLAPNPINLTALFVTNMTLVLANVSLLVGWHEEAELQLREQLVTDPLTSVLNRNGWNEAAPRLWQQAQRQASPLVLLAFDLDFFKQINDVHGHEAGDAALRFFGQSLRQSLRVGDVAARMGGEEFCVLLPQANAHAAQSFEQRLRQLIISKAHTVLGHPLNFSTGIACLSGPQDTLEHMLLRSDAALYQAKDQGRGCLVMG